MDSSDSGNQILIMWNYSSGINAKEKMKIPNVVKISLLRYMNDNIRYQFNLDRQYNRLSKLFSESEVTATA